MNNVNFPDVVFLWFLNKFKQLINGQGVTFSYFIFYKEL